jgi:glycosyltransferase involved in cell wall biosynthesis
MACRVPVLASATGGIKEVVVDGETGYLVPLDQDPVTSFPVNPEKFAGDLAAGIYRVLEEDPKKCRRFGDAGRRRVEETFSWTAIAQQTIRLYEQLIQQSSTGVRT